MIVIVTKLAALAATYLPPAARIKPIHTRQANRSAAQLLHTCPRYVCT